MAAAEGRVLTSGWPETTQNLHIIINKRIDIAIIKNNWAQLALRKLCAGV